MNKNKIISIISNIGISLVTSFTARLYGRRRTKRATEKLIKDLQEC